MNTVSGETQGYGSGGDTGSVLSGTPLGALLSDNGAAAGFSINYEAVPQAIVDLKHAADFFRKRARDAHNLANIPPPGTDGVSVNAVSQIGKWASDDGQNNLEATLNTGAQQLDDLAQKLSEDLKTYLHVEELNLPKFPTGGLQL
ncbi:MAG TPA: hypothetical protein VFO16_19840 [Pseudonocardiaceae bacterium]|nr:hypothetical protein [Pseudonocardiaceae bacterium]